jgi:hypothetical protein
VEPGAWLNLELVGDLAFVSALSARDEAALLLRIRADGEQRQGAFKSLCPPAITDERVVTQPSSDEVHVLDHAMHLVEVFQVGAHNEHPEPAASVEALRDPPTPLPTPTRRPGHVAMSEDGAHLFFVPWHAETLVSLRASHTTTRRDTSPQGSPTALWHHLLMNTLVTMNEQLASHNIQLQLDSYEESDAQTVSYGFALPHLPASLPNLLLTGWIDGVHQRVNLTLKNGHRSSGGTTGGVYHVDQSADVEVVHGLLEWARAHRVAPLTMLAPLERAYERPARQGNSPALTPAAARLLLRATLETLPGESWPHDSVPARWVDEPIDHALIRNLLNHISRAPQHPSAGLLNSLCHLIGAALETDDAIATLTGIICEDLGDDLNEGLISQALRSATKSLTRLLSEHPKRRDATLTKIEQTERAERWWEHERRVALADLSRA